MDKLKNTIVQQVVQNKGRLIEVPYTATVGDTLNVLLAKDILAVPVAAPPGQWIGAGGSMILESDKSTGAVRKQYIGMVSVLDILIHVSEEDGAEDLEGKLTTPVSIIIGHSLEGLSLWTISPCTSIYDALEPMSKGIHRALVPIESQMDHVTGLELQESSPGYHMMTQTDLVVYIHQHCADELKPILLASVGDIGAVQQHVFAVPTEMKVMDAVKCMCRASLSAVAIVEAPMNEAPSVISGIGKKIVGTFSASDLRGCTSDILRAWSSFSVLGFSRKAYFCRKNGFRNVLVSNVSDEHEMQKPLTCLTTSSLQQVMSQALEQHVHRVWVTDREGYLQGVVSLSDMLRAVRESTHHIATHNASSEH